MCPAFELVQRGFQFVAGFFAELGDAHIANVVFVHGKQLLPVDVLDHLHLDDGAGQGKGLW